MLEEIFKVSFLKAFSQKKLKLSGNMSIAMKLNQVFSSVAGKATTKTTSEVSTSQNSGLKTTTSTHKSGKFFDEVEAKLKQEGAAMTSKINAIIGFEVALTNGQKLSYFIDLKNSPGSVAVNDGSMNKFFNL
jgi:hypothetical protein